MKFVYNALHVIYTYRYTYILIILFILSISFLYILLTLTTSQSSWSLTLSEEELYDEYFRLSNQRFCNDGMGIFIFYVNMLLEFTTVFHTSACHCMLDREIHIKNQIFFLFMELYVVNSYNMSKMIDFHN